MIVCCMDDCECNSWIIYRGYRATIMPVPFGLIWGTQHTSYCFWRSDVCSDKEVFCSSSLHFSCTPACIFNLSALRSFTLDLSLCIVSLCCMIRFCCLSRLITTLSLRNRKKNPQYDFFYGKICQQQKH